MFTLAWIGYLTRISGSLSFWYEFPPSLMVIAFLKVATNFLHRYYKVRHVFQSVTVITKWDVAWFTEVWFLIYGLPILCAILNRAQIIFTETSSLMKVSFITLKKEALKIFLYYYYLLLIFATSSAIYV